MPATSSPKAARLRYTSRRNEDGGRHESHHRANLIPERISVLCVRTGCMRLNIQTSIMIVCTLPREYQPRIILLIRPHLILDTIRSARRHTVKDNHGAFLAERSKQGQSRSAWRARNCCNATDDHDKSTEILAVRIDRVLPYQRLLACSPCLNNSSWSWTRGG